MRISGNKTRSEVTQEEVHFNYCCSHNSHDDNSHFSYTLQTAINWSSCSCIPANRTLPGKNISTATWKCVRMLSSEDMPYPAAWNDLQRSMTLPHSKWDLCIKHTNTSQLNDQREIVNDSNAQYTEDIHHTQWHLVCCIVNCCIINCWLQSASTRSSAIDKGPCDASCQLKSCQLPCNSAETTCTTSPEQIQVMKLES